MVEPAVVKASACPVDATPVTTPVLEHALVGPLRPDSRRASLLASVDLLPARLRTVLVRCYLDGDHLHDVADGCCLTLAELTRLHDEALAALRAVRRR